MEDHQLIVFILDVLLLVAGVILLFMQAAEFSAVVDI
jgi:hypothetical protein